MSTMRYFVYVLVGILVGILGCSGPEVKHFDTVEDSELALLMREMFDDAMGIKAKVRAGEELSGLNRFEEIHTAIPTDPKVKGPVFEGFAQAYIESVKALESSDSASVHSFNAMVDNCMNCHSEFCPGPKMRIKKLYINTK